MDVPATIPGSRPDPAPGLGTGIAALLGLALVLLFGLAAPPAPTSILALAVPLGVAACTLPAGLRHYLLPLGGLVVLLGQFAPGMNYADPWMALLTGLALFVTLLRSERAAWELHRPALLAALFLLAPLPALAGTVVSFESWIGVYKVFVLGVGLFFALRRLVPRARAEVLLWVFPLVGTVGVLQLLAKTRGLGGLLFTRVEFRNFYTLLPWGQSNFISAVLELCLCGTILLILLVSRRWLRLILVGATLLMLQGVLLSFSRAGAVSLVAYAIVLGVGLGGARGVAALVTSAVVLLGGLFTPGGQVLLQRFTDPMEYGSWAVRVLLWENAFSRFLAHPWTGIGLNQGRYQSDLQGGDPAHNLFLDAAMEQGILGAIALLLVLVAAFRLAGRLPAPPGGSSPRTVRVLAVALLVQLVVHATAEPIILGIPILVPMIYFLAWLTLQDERVAP